MKNAIKNLRVLSQKHLHLSLLVIGVLGGFLNGLLGAGSGIIFIFALSFLFSDDICKEESDIFALSLGAVFFVTLFSVFFYAMEGKINLSAVSPYIIPAVLGGFAGAVLLGKISSFYLKAVFSLIITVSGFIMIL